MLLRIDESIIDQAKASAENLSIIRQAIENISIAHRKALHLVTGSPATLLWLYNNLNCGEETKASILKIQNNCIQNQHIHNSFNHHICIVGDHKIEGRSPIINGSSQTNLHIGRFSKFDLCKESILLGENQIDIDFLIILARAYRHANGVLTKNIKYDSKPGGGHTTAQILQSIKNQSNRLCLCVVDSDKKFPADNYKTTTTDVLKTTPSPHHLCDIHVIEFHEAENLLSISHISNLYNGDPVKKTSCQTLAHIEKSNKAILHHHDMKNGLTLGNVLSTPDQSPYGKYLRANLPTIIKHSTTLTHSTCITQNFCSNGGNCNCLLISPLGTKILNDFVESVKDFTDAKLYNHIDNHSPAEWSIIGRKTYEFFCSSEGFAL